MEKMLIFNQKLDAPIQHAISNQILNFARWIFVSTRMKSE